MKTALTRARARRRGLLAGAVLVGALAGPAMADPSTGPPGAGPLLDGQVFDGPTGAEGKDTNHIDHVVFENGRFLSEGCARWGFGHADYQAWPEGDAIRFRAVTESPTHGRLAWDGTVRGDRIQATFVWTKERILWTTRRSYWFRGTRTGTANGADDQP